MAFFCRTQILLHLFLKVIQGLPREHAQGKMNSQAVVPAMQFYRKEIKDYLIHTESPFCNNQ